MKKFLFLIAMLSLAGSSWAKCTITPDEVANLSGEPLEAVEALVTGKKHRCTLSLNGQVDGAFGYWTEKPYPPSYRWPTNTIVASTAKGRRNNEDGTPEQVVRIWIAVLNVCPSGQYACPLTSAGSRPGKSYSGYFNRYDLESALFTDIPLFAKGEDQEVELRAGHSFFADAPQQDWADLTGVARPQRIDRH
jgi:hypothetical protein